MLNFHHKTFFLVFFVAFLTILTGCATTGYEPPDPSFANHGIQEISVLPTVDHRRNRDLDTELDENILDTMKSRLEAKDYNIILSSDTACVSAVTKEALAVADQAWVKTICKSETRWVFVIVVEELVRQLGFSPWARAKIRGYLVDTETGNLVWNDDGSATVNAGYFFNALVDDWALQRAANDLTRNIPNKPKPRDK